MKNLLIFICLLSASIVVKAQSTFTSKFFGFSMEIPDGWVNVDTSVIPEKFEEYEFSDDQFKKLMELHNGSIMLLQLSKRSRENNEGVIPTIKIGARYSGTTDITVLQKNLKASYDRALTPFKGFKYIVPLSVIDFKGMKILKTVFVYSLPANGKELPVRTFTYTFLGNGFFVQAIFVDTNEQEDESQLFDRLIKTATFLKKG